MITFGLSSFLHLVPEAWPPKQDLSGFGDCKEWPHNTTEKTKSTSCLRLPSLEDGSAIQPWMWRGGSSEFIKYFKI